MKIISIIPLKKGLLKGNLTYFTSLDIPVGHIVSVPVRNSKILGLVTLSQELAETKSNVKGMDFNLKKVTEDKGPSIFLKEFLDSVFNTSKYFVQNKNNSIASLIPNLFIEEYDKISKIKENTLENNKKELKAEKLLFQYPTKDRISIYKTMIREYFARGKSIFLILPTELDIEKYIETLGRGIEQFAFTMHSGVNKKKILQNYEKIINSSHPVLIICTPPFLSIPKNNIGVIILEHESSNAYKTIARPNIDMRVFVEIFASKINAKLILADTLLRLETLERKDSDGLNTLYPLSFRTDFAGEIKILEKGQKEKGEKLKILKDESIEDIKSTLKNKKNVFIFSLRKGLATETLCKECNNTIVCDRCSSALVLYTSKDGTKRMFVCNKCNSEKDPNMTCTVCGSWNLIPLGIGTDTVYEYVKEFFPKEKIFKLDKESAKNKVGAKKIVAEFEKEEGAILIGTEMALFYLKNKVALSVIASFDSLWSIPNFRMGEKILKIMLSIIENTEDKFIIQAKNTNDGAIRAVEQENLLSFVREELSDRKILGYPPFKTFIKITYMGDKEDTQKTKDGLKEVFKEYNPEIFSGFVPKMKDKYVTNMLIKLEKNKWSLPSISPDGSIDENLHQKLSNLPPSFQVFIDPEDLL